jgi:hypothetical protein
MATKRSATNEKTIEEVKATYDKATEAPKKPSGYGLGFVCFLPFGWIYLAVKFFRRKKEFIRDVTNGNGQNVDVRKEYYLKMMSNHLIGFWACFMLVAIQVVAQLSQILSTGGEYLYHMLIFMLVVILMRSIQVAIVMSCYFSNKREIQTFSLAEYRTAPQPETQTKSTPKKKRNKFISINIRDD